MQSPEHPDLVWGGPVSFTAGRDRPVQYAVIHSTEGTEGITSAEAGSAYDRRRTDGTSTHYFHDQDTTVQEVLTSDRAHHARFHGNAIGIGHELCGLAGQTDPQWHDVASLGTLRNAAKQVARDCVKYGLPVRRLTVVEVRAAYYAPEGQRPKGICGHVDVTAAYPEDSGSHTDPGKNFPWDEFLNMVRAEMGDNMALTQADLDAVFATVWSATKQIQTGAGNYSPGGSQVVTVNQVTRIDEIETKVNTLVALITGLTNDMEALTAKVGSIADALDAGIPVALDADLLTVTSTITAAVASG